MNPGPILKALDMPEDQPAATYEEALAPFQEKVSQHTAAEMQEIADSSKQAGDMLDDGRVPQQRARGRQRARRPVRARRAP